MSTQTAFTARRKRGGRASVKNRSSVSRLRSLPIQSGSRVVRLLTTVRNVVAFPRKISSTPSWRSGARGRPAAQRCSVRLSISRTVSAARPHRAATRRTGASLHSRATAASRRWVQRALPARNGTRSRCRPHRRQATVWISTTSQTSQGPHGRSRTRRSVGLPTVACVLIPHRGQQQYGFAVSGRTQQVTVRAASSNSCWYTP